MNHAAAEWHRLLDFDRRHVWHPYTSMAKPGPVYPVVRTEGCQIHLADGTVLIDGMSSWWCAIHGYNVPRINAAIADQVARMAHVMFGGLTHEPAVRLAEKLCALVPSPLEVAFFADSGSVAVEVALKMAVQYWEGRGIAARKRFLTIRGGYHGDTFGAMSVCDPDTGMHGLFRGYLPSQVFAAAPTVPFHGTWQPSDLDSVTALLAAHHATIAAVILEPIVQGAGGMRFYHPEYLRGVRRLCEQWEVLLIADEIATGFGRTGRMFACDWAGVVPDILCLGKALTGGYMSLGATLTSRAIAETIAPGAGQALMHGPTFMGNPLTCAAANASLELLLESPWQQRVARLESQLRQELAPCAALPAVRDVRVLGAIGVIEFHDPPDVHALTRAGITQGVWLRPFGRTLYTMPPLVISPEELRRITAVMCELAAGRH
ncbi:MAG: adenosylmethionine--8-amino-7-oxononanoate transaminase [Gammaproteobacteria bacterium]|nr:adenosylmethionine--8-amino-7-oxononanoate transaminase [Gammaproteobacteria bacterium]